MGGANSKKDNSFFDLEFRRILTFLKIKNRKRLVNNACQLKNLMDDLKQKFENLNSEISYLKSQQSILKNINLKVLKDIKNRIYKIDCETDDIQAERILSKDEIFDIVSEEMKVTLSTLEEAQVYSKTKIDFLKIENIEKGRELAKLKFQITRTLNKKVDKAIQTITSDSELGLLSTFGTLSSAQKSKDEISSYLETPNLFIVGVPSLNDTWAMMIISDVLASKLQADYQSFKHK